MVYHYESKHQDHTLQVGKDKFVKFAGFEFTTDNDETAKAIEKTDYFKRGNILKSEGVIRGANEKLRGRAGAKIHQTHSGARGASAEAPKM